MTSGSELLLEIWDLIKAHVPKNDKDLFAVQLLKIFEENGIYPDELEDIRGEDRNIDNALKELYSEEDLAEDPENNEWSEI